MAGEVLAEIPARILKYEVAAGGRVEPPGNAPEFLSFVGEGCVKTTVTARGSTDTTVTVQFAKEGYIVSLTPNVGDVRGTRFGAVAHVDSTIAHLSHDLVGEMINSAGPIARLKMFAFHARALSRMIYDKSVLLALGIRERLVHELTELQALFPAADVPHGIDLPLSHQDLAEAVGASREHVMRTLAQLQNDGVLSVQNQRYAFERPPVGRGPRPTVPRPTRSPKRRDPPRGSASQLVKHLGRLGLPKRVTSRLVAGVTWTEYEAEEPMSSLDDLEAAILVEGAAHVMVDTAAGAVGAWVAKPGHFIGTGWGEGKNSRRAFRAVALQRSVVAACAPALTAEVLGLLSPDEVLRFFAYCHAGLSRQLHTRSVMLGLKNNERLLYQLRILARDFPARSKGVATIGLPLRARRDLAPLVAINPTALSRALADLESDRLVRIDSDGRISMPPLP